MAASAKLSPMLGFVCVLVSFCVVVGRPNGAPNTACTSRRPIHSNFQPQISSVPYIVGVGSLTYLIGEPVTVRILTPNSATPALRGFFLQAVDDSNTAVGAWVQHPAEHAHTFSCSTPGSDLSEAQDSVTHDDASVDKPTDLQFTWMALADYGPVRFYAVVAQSFQTFWTTNSAITLSFQAVDACTNNGCENGAACALIPFDVNLYTCLCSNLYTGIFCNVPISEAGCTPVQPCQNGGICVDTGGNMFRCICPSTYSGVICQNQNNPCVSNPCQNTGTCNIQGTSAYQCNCPATHTGTNCQTLIGLSPCSVSPCMNGGQCVTSGEGYICNCIGSWSGVNCNTLSPCGSDPCRNGGTCQTRVDFSTGTLFFYCMCQPTHTGDTCLIPVTNSCDGNRCENGATCIPVAFDIDPYSCDCTDQFNGVYCETPVGLSPCSVNPCMNGGQCVTAGEGYNCNCRESWVGVNCNTYSPCGSDPCRNGGTCQTRVDISTGTLFFICMCQPTHTGDTCLIPVTNSCDGNRCENGATCIPVAFDIDPYSCDCTDQFNGVYCETPVGLSPCSVNPCMNGGQCVTAGEGYNCNCIGSWVGVNCNILSPCGSDPCRNGGTCQTRVDFSTGTLFFNCMCQPTYTGDTCLMPVSGCLPVNPCQNGGICVPMVNSLDFTCDCSPVLAQFVGTLCQNPNPCLNSNPCQNGGQCGVSDPNGNPMRICNCPADFTGLSCESAVACVNHLCVNGQCIPQGTDYICECGPGFGSKYCDSELQCVQNPCEHGTCRDVDNSFECTCEADYFGITCNILDPCINNQCQNGGSCIMGDLSSFTCSCLPGFLGALCEMVDPCTDNPCRNGGECSLAANGVSATCSCINGFQGMVCEIDPCSSSSCENEGTCFSNQDGTYSCQCAPGFTGLYCETVIKTLCNSIPCQHDGLCYEDDTLGYVCTCQDGYSGVDCEFGEFSCESSPCKNNGVCRVSDEMKYTCTCVGDFTGRNCDVPIATNRCTLNFCKNGGTCRIAASGLACDCPADYSGTTCQTRVIIPKAGSAMMMASWLVLSLAALLGRLLQ